jgi:hypothetical protein
MSSRPIKMKRVAYEGSRQTILLARGTRTIGMCSFDARREGQSGNSLEARDRLMARIRVQNDPKEQADRSSCSQNKERDGG